MSFIEKEIESGALPDPSTMQAVDPMAGGDPAMGGGGAPPPTSGKLAPLDPPVHPNLQQTPGGAGGEI